MDFAEVGSRKPLLAAGAAATLLAVALVQCDDPAPDPSTPSTAEQRSEKLRKRVEEFAGETAETLRSHRPDDALEFENPDAGD